MKKIIICYSKGGRKYMLDRTFNSGMTEGEMYADTADWIKERMYIKQGKLLVFTDCIEAFIIKDPGEVDSK